jgi:hypothetical protein
MSFTDSIRSFLGTGPGARPADAGPSCCSGGGERPPREGSKAPASTAAGGASPAGSLPAPAQQLEVTVEKGYRPARLTARAGSPLRVTFLRTETSGCSKEVVFPGLGIRRALPTGERVSIDLPPQAAGIVPFTCGMGMMKGGIEVR